MINIFFKKNKLRKESAGGVNEKGATLIELLAAVLIFSIVILSVIGILISAIKANNRIIAKQENIDSARYSMEFMVKELRMAKSIVQKNGVFSDISFLNSADQTVRYHLDAADKKIIRNDGTATGDQPISSDNLDVSSLNFFINDWDLTVIPVETRQSPFITISIRTNGKTGVARDEIVDLQSSVSPRIY